MAVDPCTEYSVALALFDYTPVVLAGVGTVVLALATARILPAVKWPALAAGFLVTLGGLAKATWKLLVASEPCRNYPFLENMLFPCLAFGFFGIGWALHSARRGNLAPWPIWAATPVILGLGSIALWDTWPLLIASAIGAVAMAALAISEGYRRSDRVVVWLFALYVGGTMILPPLGARPNQSAEVQWIEESTNSLVQLCFVLAGVRLLSHAAKSRAAETPVGAS